MTRLNLKGAHQAILGEVATALSKVAKERDLDFELLDKHHRDSEARIEYYRTEFQIAAAKLKARYDEDLAAVTNFFNNLIANESIRINDLAAHINSITDDGLGEPKLVENKSKAKPKTEQV